MSALFEGQARAVLFDLDGTLVDSAPDMVAVLQELQRAHGIEEIAYDLGRSHVSNGALGLLAVAFPGEEHKLDSPLTEEFLNRYGERVCDRTALFEGLDGLLDCLDAAGVPWGVVTNKPTRLSTPIMETLQLAARSACTVCGDTLPQRKPHPAPMLHACELANVSAEECIYVGDAARDIEAGRNAGMATVAVGYGYIVEDDHPDKWGADKVVSNTQELTQLIRKAVNLDSE